MPSRKPRPHLTVRQLRDILTGFCNEGKGSLPVLMASDQEFNEVNGIHQLELAPDAVTIVPRHWSEA